MLKEIEHLQGFKTCDAVRAFRDFDTALTSLSQLNPVMARSVREEDPTSLLLDGSARPPLNGQTDDRASSACSFSSHPREVSSVRAQLRLYWLAAVLCCGAVLFGYDSGLIGGVLTFQSFHSDFRYGPSDETVVSAIAVGIQQVGALVGCFAIWPVNNYYGRRVAIMTCSAIFCGGVVLELVNVHWLGLFYLGRVIAGLGVGGSSSVVPIYLSEMAPKEQRGQLGSCYQFMFTIGIFVSYWIDYAVKFMQPKPAQWQIPIGLQLVPGALMGFGVLTLHESVRWLTSKGHHEQARRSLEWIRASTDEAVMDELSEIRDGIEDEKRAKEGFAVVELLEWPNAHRILLAVGMFLAQQSTGATALAYFGPQFFAMIVGPGDKTLLLTGIFGFVKVASCGVFILFISDRFGRKTLLLAGAALMSVCMIITALQVRRITDGDEADDGHGQTVYTTPVGVLTVALIYVNIIIFNLSWGPLPWPYTSEIFPTRIREPGVACGVGAQWLFNLVWSSATPFLLSTLGWATFLLFGILDVLIIVFVACCLKETVRKTLEQINAMFDDPLDGNDAADTGSEGPQPIMFRRARGLYQRVSVKDHDEDDDDPRATAE